MSQHTLPLGSRVVVHVQRSPASQVMADLRMTIEAHELNCDGEPFYRGRTEKGKARYFYDSDIVSKN